jgi:hypothetical protein
VKRSKLFKKFSLILFLVIPLFFYNNCSSQFSSLAGGSDSSSRNPGGFDLPNAVPNPPQYPPAPPVGGAITTLKIGFTTTQTTDQYVTFGQIFVPGHVPVGNSVTAAYDDGTLIPIQVDAKATHADGSLRHAVITLKLKGTAAGVQTNVNLLRTETLQEYTPIPVVNLIAAGFESVITVNLGGKVYTASARDLLQKPNVKTWLSGNMATEWIATGPIVDAGGNPHPHLTARYLIRAYAGLQSARVSVSLENDYAYVPNPSNQAYNLQVTVGSQTVIPSTNLTHLSHARWRKVFYWGQNPNENIQHQASYLLASRAVPNYDMSVIPSKQVITDNAARLSTTRGLMNIGIVDAVMAGTGGRPELGIFPGWTVQYLLSQDPVAKDIALTMGELAGSWSFHYRDEKTDLPLTLDEYPYSTLAGNPGDTLNPATNKQEAFPACSSCDTPYAADTAHQPDFAYVPYLVTGDFFYLEELQFWAAGNLFAPNPYYRQFGVGILNADQIRGQAWTIRSVALAAYISPDSTKMKSYFTSRLKNNITYFNTTFLSAGYNKMGVNLEGGYALAYNNRGFAPWMDNFFTSVFGMINDLGYTEVAPALNFKTKFPVSMMLDPGFCWLFSSAYRLYMQGPSETPPLYTTLAELWQNTPDISPTYGMACNSMEMQNTMASLVSTKPILNYMTGSQGAEGYVAVMKSALAYAVTSGAPGSQAAWDKYMTNSNAIDWSGEPQFDIIPRK